MTDTALYAYAVLPADAAAPATPQAVLPGATPHLLQEAGLAVLVSEVPRAAFEPGPDSRMGDPAWVAERAQAHHAVVAAAASAGCALPLAFGALFSGEAPLRAWLRGSADALGTALNAVEGCEEWSVSLVEDVARHGAFVAFHDRALRTLSEQAAAAPEGTAFLLERRLEKSVQAARAARRAELGTALAAILARHARQAEMTPPARKPGMGWTALVPAGAVAALRAELDAFAAGCGDSGIDLALSGPWPPYAFARGALRDAG